MLDALSGIIKKIWWDQVSLRQKKVADGLIVLLRVGAVSE
jgi:hypothetical protein